MFQRPNCKGLDAAPIIFSHDTSNVTSSSCNLCNRPAIRKEPRPSSHKSVTLSAKLFLLRGNTRSNYPVNFTKLYYKHRIPNLLQISVTTLSAKSLVHSYIFFKKCEDGLVPKGVVYFVFLRQQSDCCLHLTLMIAIFVAFL